MPKPEEILQQVSESGKEFERKTSSLYNSLNDGWSQLHEFYQKVSSTESMIVNDMKGLMDYLSDYDKRLNAHRSGLTDATRSAQQHVVSLAQGVSQMNLDLLAKNIGEFTEILRQRESQSKALRERLGSLVAEFEGLFSELFSLRGVSQKFFEAFRAWRTSASQLVALLENLSVREKELNQREERLHDRESNIQHQQSKLEGAKAAFMEILEELERKKAEFSKLQGELERVQPEKEKMERAVSALKERQERIVQESQMTVAEQRMKLQKEKRVVIESEQRLVERRERLDLRERALAEREEGTKRQEAGLRGLHTRVTELEDKISRLERENFELREKLVTFGVA